MLVTSGTNGAGFYLDDLAICGEQLPGWYRALLKNFKRGPCVFKLDYALSAPVLPGVPPAQVSRDAMFMERERHANVRAGDEILVTELEHHSNIDPWQQLAARTGPHAARASRKRIQAVVGRSGSSPGDSVRRGTRAFATLAGAVELMAPLSGRDSAREHIVAHRVGEAHHAVQWTGPVQPERAKGKV